MTPEEVLADRVLAADRRRRRRRSAWIVSGVVTAAIAVAVPLFALGGGGGGGSDAAAAANNTSGAAADGTNRVSDQASIYAAALSHQVTGSSERTEVFVRDYVCNTVITKPGSQCADSPIPMSVRLKMAQLLPFPVRFVAQEWGPRNGPEKSLTVFGTLTIAHRNRATLGIETLCGLMCGEGKTLVLSRTGDGWQVTGDTGPDWIS